MYRVARVVVVKICSGAILERVEHKSTQRWVPAVQNGVIASITFHKHGAPSAMLRKCLQTPITRDHLVSTIWVRRICGFRRPWRSSKTRVRISGGRQQIRIIPFLWLLSCLSCASNAAICASISEIECIETTVTSGGECRTIRWSCDVCGWRKRDVWRKSLTRCCT
jgi:hypothetical protein